MTSSAAAVVADFMNSNHETNDIIIHDSSEIQSLNQEIEGHVEDRGGKLKAFVSTWMESRIKKPEQGRG